MADALNASSAEAERLKRETLALMAEKGRAALAGVDQGAASLAAAQQSATDAMLSGAQARGAPASAQAALTSYAAQPQQQAAASLATLKGITDADLQRQTKANDLYLGQVGAAVPAIRAASDAKIAQIKAARAADDALKQRQLDLEGRRLGLDERELALREAGGGDPSDIIKRLGGSGIAASLLGQGGDQYTAVEKSDPYSYKRGANGPGSAPASDEELRAAGVEVVGRDLGLPPGYSTALTAKGKPADNSDEGKAARSIGVATTSLPKLRSSPTYSKASAYVQAALQEKRDDIGTLISARKSKAEIVAALRSTPEYRTHPKTVNLAIRDLLSG